MDQKKSREPAHTPTKYPRLQAAFAAIDQAIDLSTATEQQLVVAAKARGLMIGYEARWGDGNWRLLGEPEQVVHLPIINPATGRRSRTFTQAGKFDGVVEGYGKTALLEHKSTSEDIGDPNSVYWRRLAIDSQVSKYMLQSWQGGQKLDGALYDVVRKPQIRPKQLTAVVVDLLHRHGRYFGFNVSSKVRESVAAGQSLECPYLFGLRVASDVIAQPERYYQRRLVPRLDDEVVEYAEELWTIADEIRRANIDNGFFRNTNACMEWGRPCAFLGICSGHDTPKSDNWRRVQQVHEELPAFDLRAVPSGGRLVLTNSSIKCFQSCRRRFYYHYNQGIRHVREDEPEALYFGTVLHEALAAWWAQTGENHGNDDDSAVNEVAEFAAAG